MALTIESAKQILDDYYDLVHPKYEDDIAFMDALEFLIKETNETEYMVELGGWYYEQKQFDLAEEYYLMAAKQGNVDAYECLGYIYYYGRVGQPDYEKAFHYYKLASDLGDVIAAYKLADMYKNGYYVSKDYTKYVQIIKGGSLTLAHSRNSQMSFMYGFFFVKFLFFTVVCVVIMI